MSSTDSASGVAATMKADKANRDSLAKRKSAVKADLERVTAELADVEQMKAEAEDLEDEELLSEMLAEEQRLQGLRQQYTAELASIQEQSQAAAQALRQRLRRLTSGDRSLGASGKSTSSESSQLATVPSADLTAAAESAGTPGTQTLPAAAQSPQAAPVSTSFKTGPTQTAASTAAYSAGPVHSVNSEVARPDLQSSYGTQPTMSNQPLSASWGAPAPVQMSIPSQTSEMSTFGDRQTPPQQQQPSQYSSQGINGASAQHPSYLNQTPDAAPHSSSVAQSEASQPHSSAGSSFAQPAASNQSSRDTFAASNGQDNASISPLQDQSFTPTLVQSNQTTSRGLSEVSKPPRPASTFTGQQGGAKTGTPGGPALGLSSKASMMSERSGYQADSDSNSDVQVDAGRPSLASDFSPPVQPYSEASVAAGTPHESSTAAGEAASAADKEADSNVSAGTPSTLLGKVGQSVWGAVEAITGQPHHEDTSTRGAGAKSADSAADATTSDTPLPAGKTVEPQAETADLTRTDSGYEAGEEGPVQAGPEGTASYSPTSAAVPGAQHDYKSTSAAAPGAEHDYRSTSAAAPGVQHDYAAAGDSLSPGPLHVQTDTGNSKRGFSGVGDEQPGSASKRPRGDSAVARLSNTFDSPKSEPLSPSAHTRGPESPSARSFFSSAAPKDSQGGFTLGTSPAQGRAAANSPFSSTTAATAYTAPRESLDFGAREEEAYLPSTQASQGSFESNRDLHKLGSISSIGNQSELNRQLDSASQTQGLTHALPESAANLALTGGNTGGVTGGSPVAVSSVGVPVVDAEMSTLPPSASWGRPPSPPKVGEIIRHDSSPSITQPIASATEQASIPLDVQKERAESPAVIAPTEQDLNAPASHKRTDSPAAQDTSAAAGGSASAPSSTHTTTAARLPDYDSNPASYEAQPAATQQSPTQTAASYQSSVPSSYSAQSAAPVTAAAGVESPVTSTYSTQPLAAPQAHSGYDSAAATDRTAPVAVATSPATAAAVRAAESEMAKPFGSTVSTQEQPHFGEGIDAFDRSVHPVQNASGSTTQHDSGFGQTAAAGAPLGTTGFEQEPVQSRQHGFEDDDDAFAQFSPFGQKARQQASPFGQQAAAKGQQGVSKGQQGVSEEQGVSEGQKVPSGAGAGLAAVAQGAAALTAVQTDRAISSTESTSPAAPGAVREQVTPTSVTGTFAEQNPFQSGRPGQVATQRLDSQQSFGAGSVNELSPRSGLGSPRRRPPPPPGGQDSAAFTQTTSGLSGSSLQGPQDALQQPPSAKGQLPSTAAFQQPQSAVAHPPDSATTTGAGLTTGIVRASEALPTRATPVPQAAVSQELPSRAPVSPKQASPVDTATTAALLPAQVSSSSASQPPETAYSSAFGKANAAGLGPNFSSDAGQASPVSKPRTLASWTSFEDPGPLPPMPAPSPDDDPAIDEDFWAPSKTTGPTAATAVAAKPTASAAQTSQPAPTAAESALVTKPDKQRTNDPWAAEPPPDVKAAEQELLTSNLAGLGIGGDAAWGNSFGADMGKPMASEAAAVPTPAASAAPTSQETVPTKTQEDSLTSQPSWMQMASSSNPFSQFIPLGDTPAEPNPWATTATPSNPSPTPQPPPTGQPMSSAVATTSAQQQPQQQQQTGFGGWDSFNQSQAASASPVAYPSVDSNRHPDVVNRSSQLPAGAKTLPEQQQYPAPPSGPAPKGEDPFSPNWAAFGASGQTPQQSPQQPAGGDLWSAFAAPSQQPQQQQQQQPQQQQQQPPRSAMMDSWASFDAPSEQTGLGAPVASQQTSQGISNINSQDSWSAFDPNNNAGARSRATPSDGFPTPSSSSSQQAQQAGSASGYGGYDTAQPTSPDRKGSIEEIPVQDLGLDPSLTITATPKAGTQPPSSQFGYPQQSSALSQGYDQPPQKPKRGSSNQFGSVFSSGSANSVSKLTSIFKKDKKGAAPPSAEQYNGQGPESLPPTPRQGGALGGSSGTAIGQSGGFGAALPPTPRGRRAQPPPPPTTGQEVSEVDSWRPQTTEERQQCMDAYDAKGYGRLGGLSEVDARALWTRQNMPPDLFAQVFALSDMDSNKLLSKPEFCLYMYLMHALRNFGGSFRLPNQITPNQAAKILGLEQLIRPSTGATPAVSSTQAYSTAPASSNGSLQPPQQYPQQQFGGSQDWQTTGGLSPSQQQAVQELTALGFDARQSQEALEAHTWNKNAAANWLLQGGSNVPQGPALRRSTTDRSSYPSSFGSGGSGGFGSQSLRGSGTPRMTHTRTTSASSNADWGSGNWSPTIAGGDFSQPGSARTTGDSVVSPRFGTPSGTPRSRAGRVPVQGNGHLSLTIRKAKMDYKGIMEKPFFTLSVRTRGGSLLETSQDTPPGVFTSGMMISDHTLILETPISEFPQGAVLFFELKHWKPKDKKFSLRGWALVAVSSLVDYSSSPPQLQTGTMKLSLLQKPVDLALSRKHKRLSPEGFDLEVNVNLA